MREYGNNNGCANQKGGVGKTTTVLNLGAALAEVGRQVVMLDMDPQASLTLAVGAEDGEGYVDQLLEAGGRRAEAKAQAPGLTGKEGPALPTVGGVSVIPSRFELADTERRLAASPDGQQWLARGLEGLKEEYDFILIDCPPSLGQLTVTALVAADWALIPMQCDYLALRGVALALKAVQTIQEQTDAKLKVLGVLPTVYNPRTVHSEEVVRAARERLGKLVLNTTIRYSAWVKKSPVARESVLSYAGYSAVADDYRKLAGEVIDHVE